MGGVGNIGIGLEGEAVLIFQQEGIEPGGGQLLQNGQHPRNAGKAVPHIHMKRPEGGVGVIDYCAAEGSIVGQGLFIGVQAVENAPGVGRQHADQTFVRREEKALFPAGPAQDSGQIGQGGVRLHGDYGVIQAVRLHGQGAQAPEGQAFLGEGAGIGGGKAPGG